MCFPQRAKFVLQAMICRFQSTKQSFRRFKHTHTASPNAESSSESQHSNCSVPRRRSSFYNFIAPQIRNFHGNELLLLSKRITIENEARTLTANGFGHETYPINDIIAHSVTQLSDEELMMVQKAITDEFELRGRAAHEELLAEEFDEHDGDEANRGYIPVDEVLESMGRVDLASIDMCHGCFGGAECTCSCESESISPKSTSTISSGERASSGDKACASPHAMTLEEGAGSLVDDGCDMSNSCVVYAAGRVE